MRAQPATLLNLVVILTLLLPGGAQPAAAQKTARSADAHAEDVTTQIGGATTRVSIASDGAQGNGKSDSPASSADGRYVVFSSEAGNLVSNDSNNVYDVFVHDRETRQTIRVSVSSSGGQGNGPSFGASISADGRYVAFKSYASNLVSGDTNNAGDVFVRDRDVDEDGIFDEPGQVSTARISVDSNGAQGNELSIKPAISADGRYVAFESWASNLVTGDTNGQEDVFVHDRQTGQTVRVSVASDGAQANDQSDLPAISADGRYVTFASEASNLASGDNNNVCDTDNDGVYTDNCPDVFVRDRDADGDGIFDEPGQVSTVRVSVTSDGSQTANGWSAVSSLSSDGNVVAFESRASDLVSGDTNGVYDIFVRDRQAGVTSRVSVASDGAQGNAASQSPSLSADGRYVAFVSQASLVSDDTNGMSDIYLHDRQTGQTVRVSIASDGTPGNGNSQGAALSADGGYVAFSSSSDNLISSDTNGMEDVFVHDTVEASGSCFADEFSSSPLSPGWTWVDPLDDSSYSLEENPGYLRISVPDGHHDLDPPWYLDAPRILQSINGNFNVEIKVRVNPTVLFQSAGLLVWFDQDNFVWIGRSTYNRIGDRFVRDGEVLESPPEIRGITQTTVYFRITREGNTISNYYSLDNSNWSLFRSDEYPSAPAVADAGMYVLNNDVVDATDTSIVADFDYFRWCVGIKTLYLPLITRTE